MGKVIFLCLALALFVWPGNLIAESSYKIVDPIGGEAIQFDNNISIQDVEGLRLQLIQNPQEPGSKNVRFDLVITSQIDSDRVQLRWQVLGKSEFVSGEEVKSLSVQRGSTYTHSVVLRPRDFGITRITAVVEAFQADGTRIASASRTFGSYDTGEIFPPVEGQDSVNLMYTIRNIIFIVVGSSVLIAGGIYARRWFAVWLNNRNT